MFSAYDPKTAIQNQGLREVFTWHELSSSNLIEVLPHSANTSVVGLHVTCQHNSWSNRVPARTDVTLLFIL